MFEIYYCDKYLHLKVSGKLTHLDYAEHLIPTIETAITNSGKVRVLLEINDFQGWELRAAWDDFNVGIKHRKDFDKIAILGDRNWQKLIVKFFALFLKGETNFYSNNQYQDAHNWLSSD